MKLREVRFFIGLKFILLLFLNLIQIYTKKTRKQEKNELFLIFFCCDLSGMKIKTMRHQHKVERKKAKGKRTNQRRKKVRRKKESKRGKQE
jgi:hypothetical protein